jgi:hypothetical protein
MYWSKPMRTQDESGVVNVNGRSLVANPEQGVEIEYI